jgi:hypothetical protein
MADYTLADRESGILGQEFLTWLWFKSEVLSGLFKTPKGEHFTVFVEQRVSVEGGEGDSKETATVSGAHSELREARLGLRNGKKVNKALLKFEQDSEEWTMMLKAEDFGVGPLKTPKVETKREEGDDPDAAFLEKFYLIEKCSDFLDCIFQEFLQLRISSLKWNEEVDAFREWVAK